MANSGNLFGFRRSMCSSLFWDWDRRSKRIRTCFLEKMFFCLPRRFSGAAGVASMIWWIVILAVLVEELSDRMPGFSIAAMAFASAVSKSSSDWIRKSWSMLVCVVTSWLSILYIASDEVGKKQIVDRICRRVFGRYLRVAAFFFRCMM